MLRCPICDVLSPNVVVQCVCGYELATGEPGTAIARLEERRRGARGVTARGALTVAAGPVAIATYAWLPSVVGILMPPVGVALICLGVIWMVRGVGEGRDVRRRIRAARRLSELPQARLLTR